MPALAAFRYQLAPDTLREDRFFRKRNPPRSGKTPVVGLAKRTNIIEGFWSLLKRGINGTFHHVGRQHLDRYVSEFQFRFNNRKVEDSVRALMAIQGAEGKRLVYKEVVQSNR